MAIEPGQLRRWYNDVDGLDGPFLVLRSEGMLYPGGLRRGGVKQEHWEILLADGVCGGWSEGLLNQLSETIDG